MKVAIVFAALFAVAFAYPGGDQEATILRNDLENIGVDGYKFAYETSNGISHNQEGQLKNAGSEQEAIDVHGEYSYTDPQTGKNVKVVFTADESGYRPHTVIS